MLKGIIAGPTASGKSTLAFKIAERNGFALINGDSRQIYRGMTLGTAAPSQEEQAKVPHHLFQCLDPSEVFSPQRYAESVWKVLAEEKRDALLVGGSGLYLKALLCPAPADRGEMPPAIRLEAERRLAEAGLPAIFAWLLERDPAAMVGVQPQDGYRLQKRLEHQLWKGDSYAQYRSVARDHRLETTPLLVLEWPRAQLHDRIRERLQSMWAQGWPQEVASLTARFGDHFPAINALGYREITQALAGSNADKILACADIGRLRDFGENLGENLLAKTRQYAKKQIAFFRSQLPGALFCPAEALNQAFAAIDHDWKAFQSAEFAK